MQIQISGLDDRSLLEQTREAVQNERKATTTVLHHLREVERRKLFADLGYPSLFEYCVRELGYSEASAQRRISSMRLLRELPEFEKKIESGALSLSVVSQAQTFFRQEARVEKPLTLEEKREVLHSLENKSSREAERTLLARSSSPTAMTRETIRPITETLSELKFVADEELMDDLEKLKGLLAHSHPNMGLADLVRYMAKLTLEKIDPARDTKNPLPAPETEKRAPSRPLKREIWKRDRGECSFVDPKTGRKCGSRHFLPYYSPQVMSC